MRILAFAVLAMLMGTVAYAQIPSDLDLRISTKSLSETNVSVLVSNTKQDVLYELQIKQNKTNWVSLGFFDGPEITNCVSFNSRIPDEFRTNNHIPITAKSIRVRSWQDSSQGGRGGMADWWLIKYFGDINVDGYATPMGDGWFTATKWKNGMNPFKWYPPPEPKAQFPYNNPPSHPKPPPFAELSNITTAIVSNTILSVIATQQTNGYELKVLRPKIHARYLLLVRDQNDRQWRASGYFVSGANENPVILHADKLGMMTDVQSPIALPVVKSLPDVIQPEFIAGWGEDSDGDGLPDIYEVLVTHTDPDDADTGYTGIPDGFRVISNDGWNNWEKFRFRVNPFQKCEPPPPVVLITPNLSELMRAETLKTNLPYEPQIEIRTNTAANFQPYSLWLDSHYLSPNATGHARGDARISWKVPPANP